MDSRQADLQVQVAATAGFLDALVESGCDSDAILRTVGPSRGDLDDPDNAIALAQFIGLLDLGAHHSGDRCFGLHLGTRLDPADMGVLGFVALNSSDIGRAILNVGRYISVMKDQCRVILEVERPTARVRYRLSTMNARTRRQDSDLAMSRMQSFIRGILAPDSTPQEVQLEHAPPGDRGPTKGSSARRSVSASPTMR